MRQFTITVDDKPGALASVADILAKAKVNIQAISAERLPTEKKAILRIVVDNDDETRKALAKEKLNFKDEEIVILRLEDRPGALAQMAKKIAEAGLNFETLYIFRREEGATEVALKVDMMEKVKDILKVK